MENVIKNPQAKWYVELVSQCNDLAHRLGLSDEMADEMKMLMIHVAKEQFKAGNRSGIAWMRKQMEGTAVR